MFSIWAVIAIAVSILVVGLLVYAAGRPGQFAVARSIVICASPEKIFPLMNDPRAALAWNPFIKADPDIKLAFAGPASGVGARNAWDGNMKVGKGSVEITESIAPERIVLRLDMIKPMKGQNRVEYALVQHGEGTRVTWSMTGAQPFMGKLMSVFIDCDKMCGDQFEMGLADLKGIVEGAVAPVANAPAMAAP